MSMTGQGIAAGMLTAGDLVMDALLLLARLNPG